MSFDKESGEYECDGCGHKVAFLPEVPAQSAPYEFIHTGCPGTKDKEHPAGTNRHHLIDPQAVADWYQAHGGKDGKGVKVPSGYVSDSRVHIANVEEEQRRAASGAGG